MVLLWFQLFNFFFDNFSSQTPCSSDDPIDILRKNVVKAADLDSEGLIIQFDIDSIKTVKNKLKDEKNEKNENMSFEHITLLHKKSREILIQPLVEAYLHLKWQSLKIWWFAYRLVFFLAFGVCLTLLISFIVEMNSHCKYETYDSMSNKTTEGESRKFSKSRLSRNWTFTIPDTRCLKLLKIKKNSKKFSKNF